MQGDKQMARTIHVTLPVADLERSIRFYKAIGCRESQRSGERKACVHWSEGVVVQLMARANFGRVVTKPVANAHAVSQVLFSLSPGSRADVDAAIAAARRAGGRVDARRGVDLGFVYTRALEDPDGHAFELVWIDPEIEKLAEAAPL
jgi:hypothetical protein